jgi:uncharacterized protein involved in exopolysaccharide biosynthesis
MEKTMAAPANRTPRDWLDRAFTLARRMGRYWIPAALVVVIGGAASLALSYTRKRVYRSETVILYREGIRSTYIGWSDADPARKMGLRLKEMVLARSRLQKIVEEFTLYPEIVEDRGYIEAVDEMLKHVTFKVRDGDTFMLAFEGEKPDLVQKVTARMASLLVEENAKSRAAEAEGTLSFLETQKKQAEDELRTREAAFAKFLAKHPEFVSEMGAGAGASIRAAEKKQQATPEKKTDSTLLALEREASRIKERLGQPTQKKKELDPKLSATVNDAEAELATAQKELIEKTRQFTEAHPDVRAAKARVKAAEGRLSRARDMLAAGDALGMHTPQWVEPTDRATLQAQLDKLNQQIASYRARLEKKQSGAAAAESGTGANWIVALETEFEQLRRELDEARKKNDELQTKSTTAAIAASAETSGNRARMEVVDPAYKPTRPVRAERSLFAGIGLLVSLALALTLALICALFDDHLYDRFDIERLGIMPLLVAVPRAGRRDHV